MWLEHCDDEDDEEFFEEKEDDSRSPSNNIDNGRKNLTEENKSRKKNPGSLQHKKVSRKADGNAVVAFEL